MPSFFSKAKSKVSSFRRTVSEQSNLNLSEQREKDQSSTAAVTSTTGGKNSAPRLDLSLPSSGFLSSSSTTEPGATVTSPIPTSTEPGRASSVERPSVSLGGPWEHVQPEQQAQQQQGRGGGGGVRDQRFRSGSTGGDSVTLASPRVGGTTGRENLAEQAVGKALSNARLSVQEVEKLIHVCASNIKDKGLDTLGLFRPHRLAESQSSISRLSSLFLSSVQPSSITLAPSLATALPEDLFGKAKEPFTEFEEECRYAGVHDLVAVLKWGLRHLSYGTQGFAPPPSDSTSIPQGTPQRWSWYRKFSSLEKSSSYRSDAFTSILLPLIPASRHELLRLLLDLISSIAANAEINAMTGSHLCKILGFWVLGCGENDYTKSPGGGWEDLYEDWIWSGRSFEHLFLCWLKEQKALPTRLEELIVGYETKVAAGEGETEGGVRLVTPKPQKTLRIRLEPEPEVDVSGDLNKGIGESTGGVLASKSGIFARGKKSSNFGEKDSVGAQPVVPTALSKVPATDLFVAALSLDSTRAKFADSEAKDLYYAIVAEGKPDPATAAAATEGPAIQDPISVSKVLDEETVRLLEEFSPSLDPSSPSSKSVGPSGMRSVDAGTLSHFSSSASMRSSAVASATMSSEDLTTPTRGRSFSFDTPGNHKSSGAGNGLGVLYEEKASNGTPPVSPTHPTLLAPKDPLKPPSPLGNFPNKSAANLPTPSWTDFASSGFSAVSLVDSDPKVLSLSPKFSTGSDRPGAAGGAATMTGAGFPPEFGGLKRSRSRGGSSLASRATSRSKAGAAANDDLAPISPTLESVREGLFGKLVSSQAFISIREVDETFADLWLDSLGDRNVTRTWPAFAIADIKNQSVRKVAASLLVDEYTKKSKKETTAATSSSSPSVTGDKPPSSPARSGSLVVTGEAGKRDKPIAFGSLSKKGSRFSGIFGPVPGSKAKIPTSSSPASPLLTAGSDQKPAVLPTPSLGDADKNQLSLDTPAQAKKGASSPAHRKPSPAVEESTPADHKPTVAAGEKDDKKDLTAAGVAATAAAGAAALGGAALAESKKDTVAASSPPAPAKQADEVPATTETVAGGGVDTQPTVQATTDQPAKVEPVAQTADEIEPSTSQATISGAEPKEEPTHETKDEVVPSAGVEAISSQADPVPTPEVPTQIGADVTGAQGAPAGVEDATPASPQKVSLQPPAVGDVRHRRISEETVRASNGVANKDSSVPTETSVSSSINPQLEQLTSDPISMDEVASAPTLPAVVPSSVSAEPTGSSKEEVAADGKDDGKAPVPPTFSETIPAPVADEAHPAASPSKESVKSFKTSTRSDAPGSPLPRKSSARFLSGARKLSDKILRKKSSTNVGEDGESVEEGSPKLSSAVEDTLPSQVEEPTSVSVTESRPVPQAASEPATLNSTQPDPARSAEPAAAVEPTSSAGSLAGPNASAEPEKPAESVEVPRSAEIQSEDTGDVTKDIEVSSPSSANMEMFSATGSPRPSYDAAHSPANGSVVTFATAESS